MQNLRNTTTLPPAHIVIATFLTRLARARRSLQRTACL